MPTAGTLRGVDERHRCRRPWYFVGGFIVLQNAEDPADRRLDAVSIKAVVVNPRVC